MPFMERGGERPGAELAFAGISAESLTSRGSAATRMQQEEVLQESAHLRGLVGIGLVERSLRLKVL